MAEQRVCVIIDHDDDEQELYVLLPNGMEVGIFPIPDISVYKKLITDGYVTINVEERVQ